MGTLSIAHCPQPNLDVSVVNSMAGLSMVLFLYTVGRLVTHQERSLIDSGESVICNCHYFVARLNFCQFQDSYRTGVHTGHQAS